LKSAQDFAVVTFEPHETFSQDETRKATRRTGVVLFLVFCALCTASALRNRPSMTWMFSALAAVGFALFLFPGPCKPLYLIWRKFGILMGRIVAAAILTLAYYLMITPIGVAMRRLGRTPLTGKADGASNSYWISRSEPWQMQERFHKRY
jgi:hypothetical protein